jgi:hypothetical protein
MPSTYTTNLGLEKPATGEQGGVWGNTANNSYDFLDSATDGSLSITLSASSYNLTTLQGAASQGRNKVIIFTGTLTQNATVNITPNTAEKIYFVTNSTAGGFEVLFQQGAGAVFALLPGLTAMIYCDGLGSAASVRGVFTNAQFGSVVTTSLTVSGQSAFTAATFSAPVTFSGAVALNAQTTALDLVINTAGSAVAAYDIYYRAPGSGAATPLAIGSPGQVLEVNNAGQPAWATITLGVGATVAGASPFGIFLASASALLAQSGNLTWNGAGLGIGLQASFPLHIGGALPPQAWLDGAAGSTRELGWATSGSPRWALVSPAAAETGGNAGSNLGFASYSDGGGQLGWALMLFRSSGHVSVGTSADGGCQLFVQNAAAGQPAMIVRGAPGQSQPLQLWQNSAGATLASIDQNGVLSSAGGGNYLSLNAQGRLNLWGVVAGAPLGTLHIGPEPAGFPNMSCSLVMEVAQYGPTNMPPGAIRMYYRNNMFVIQFFYNNAQYYATLSLAANPGNPVTWYISPTPV